MNLPGTLQNRIIDFLKSLPNIDDTKSRRAFIYSAGLDPQVKGQIQFDGALAQFVPLLVETLLDYGTLNDGRSAIEVLLEATKIYTGQDKNEYCDVLIQELRDSEQKQLQRSLQQQSPSKSGLLRLKPCSTNHTLPCARYFQSRPELQSLHRFWRNNDMHGIFLFIGMGGVGKTSLIRHFLAQLPESNINIPNVQKDLSLPVHDALFIWSFYTNPDPDTCSTALYNYLSQEQKTKATFEQIQEILDKQWQGRRVLIIFDGFEKLQIVPGIDPENEGGTFGQFLHEAAALSKFLAWICDSCYSAYVIISSRFELIDLRRYIDNKKNCIVNVDKLSEKCARDLLRKCGVKGMEWQLDEVIHEFGNHAQTLDLLGNALSLRFGGDVAYWNEIPSLEDVRNLAGLRDQVWGRVRVLKFYESILPEQELKVLQCLCLFYIIPATTQFLVEVFVGKVDGHSRSPLAGLRPDEINDRLRSLCIEYHLVYSEPHEKPNQFIIHPAIKDYFYSTLKDSGSWHKAFIDTLSTKIDELLGLPLNIPSSHPLSQEEQLKILRNSGKFPPSKREILDLVEECGYHILRAGYCGLAFSNYINFMGGFVHLGEKLGLSARAERFLSLFVKQDNRNWLDIVLPEEAKPVYLSSRGLHLQRLGLLEKAIMCFKQGAEIRKRAEMWKRAGVLTENLAETLWLRGRLPQALVAAEESVEMAERSKDYQRLAWSYGYRANIRRSMGFIHEALDDFADSSGFHYLFDPSIDFLYSNVGHWYAAFFIQLGKYSDALCITRDNYQISKYGKHQGDSAKCELLLADLACREGKFDIAHKWLGYALSWARESSEQQILIWGRLLQAQITSQKDIETAKAAIRDGLRVAEIGGYGLYWIDLLITRGYLRIEEGIQKAKAGQQSLANDLFALAESDAWCALNGMRKDRTPSADSSENLSEFLMLGACHPECHYVWGEGDARHLLGKIFLHQGRWKDAHTELKKSLVLRKKLQDPREAVTRELIETIISSNE